ncbi:HTH-type transcriptional repressor Bm3R1 [Flavobacteriaceae bacterium UJ101]|nr:HTH-type transcriptional repressor Bm3R1 [Flavobacteriaceae bacterium UJ101]
MVTLEKSIKKRKALLKATLNLVNNSGFQGASMSKIARMAKVSPATIYLYFENKQDLINQLYLEVKEDFSKAAFENYTDSMSIKDGFELIWHNIARYKLNQVEYAYFLSQADNTPIVDQQTIEKGLVNLQPLLDLWNRGIEENVIKPYSPYLLYAYSIYPIAFLMTIQKREAYVFSDACLKNAFQAAWDSIKMK